MLQNLGRKQNFERERERATKRKEKEGTIREDLVWEKSKKKN